MYPIDFIPHNFKIRERITEIIAEEYQKGLSLSDISKKLGRSKHFIRSCLMREGIILRNKFAQAMSLRKLKRGKQGARPYYGFCYVEGEIVKYPKEYPTLLVIYRLWKSEKTVHQIVTHLNTNYILSRTGRRWSWAAIKLIVTRFRDGSIKIDDETLN